MENASPTTDSQDSQAIEKKNPNVDDKYFRTTKRGVIQSLIIGIAAVLVALFLVFFFVLGVSTVDGNSMVPTLTDGQTLVFFRREASFDRGEIIRVDMPSGDYYVKRVIAVAGDTIDLVDGEVYLNGELLTEGYIQGKTYPTNELVTFPLTVSPGKVFVMGDNRENSVDSRELGEIPYIMIGGKILGQ